MAKIQTSNEIESMIANETIVEKDVSEEMRHAYLTYAIMTIIDRALPDVRDGLKPVQRRILYSMYDQNIKPSGSYKKSARIVGDVIGRFHPHGDTSCYGAMTNLINDFDIRYPLVDGHGNFGSNDGDGAAAMRYTEAKLEKLAMEMLQDIDNNGVQMQLNFSEDEWEPEVLPAKIPYLLVNGASGIATGYTTEIPSHNMNEVCDGIIATIKNPDITIEELVSKYIKGPDLPSYGYLLNDENILQLYTTGQATLKFQGKIETEVNNETNNKQIIITEIPPAVSKPALLKKLYDMYVANKDKKVIDLRDESEGNGIRIVLELHKTAIPEILIQDIYDNTPLSKSKSYILRAIVEQAPLLLNLKQIIEYYIEQRKEVIERRTKYKLEKLEKKINILNGFKIIINDVKTVVNLIVDSDSPSDASDKLKTQYGLNDEQAKAILTTQLSSLTKMEKNKVINELQTLEAEAEGYREILSSGQKVNKVIIDELKDLKKTYGDERKTKILDPQTQSSQVIETEISNEPMFIGLTNKNLIKTMPYTTFEKMLKNKSLKEKTNVFTQGLKCSMSDTFVLILSDGNYIKCDFTTLTNELTFINKNQKIISILRYNNLTESEEVAVLMSKKGFVKKMQITSFKAKNLRITSAFELTDGDEIIATRIALDNDTNAITLCTQNGLIHRFFLRAFSATSQTAKALGCLNIDEDDLIVDFDISDSSVDEKYKLLMFNSHDNKITLKPLALSDFLIKNRMAKGVKALTYFKKDIGKTKKLVLTCGDFFMIGNSGEVILKRYDEVNVLEKNEKPIDIDYDIITSKFLL